MVLGLVDLDFFFFSLAERRLAKENRDDAVVEEVTVEVDESLFPMVVVSGKVVIRSRMVWYPTSQSVARKIMKTGTVRTYEQHDQTWRATVVSPPQVNTSTC